MPINHTVESRYGETVGTCTHISRVRKSAAGKIEDIINPFWSHWSFFTTSMVCCARPLTGLRAAATSNVAARWLYHQTRLYSPMLVRIPTASDLFDLASRPPRTRISATRFVAITHVATGAIVSISEDAVGTLHVSALFLGCLELYWILLHYMIYMSWIVGDFEESTRYSTYRVTQAGRILETLRKLSRHE